MDRSDGDGLRDIGRSTAGPRSLAADAWLVCVCGQVCQTGRVDIIVDRLIPGRDGVSEGERNKKDVIT